ncbi:hypothetical protein V1514DRAFT_328184 [Lipomyces japonicus]|uniref:uncharacterized protein n=1 Tax=Lipomyces japonicus TaxID=56871 RepID=UPI0034CF845F
MASGVSDGNATGATEFVISIIQNAIPGDGAREIYQERVENRPLPLHPTEQQQQQNERVPKENKGFRIEGCNPTTLDLKILPKRIRKLDRRAVRALARGAKKQVKIAEKKKRLRERRKRNERRKKAKGSKGTANQEDVEMVNADEDHEKTILSSTEQVQIAPELEVKVNEGDQNQKESVKKHRSQRKRKPSNKKSVRSRLLDLVRQDEVSSDEEESAEKVVVKRPKPLSSAERKRLQLYELGQAAHMFATYVPLYHLWQSYARELLSINNSTKPPTKETQCQAYASKLTSADFHGAFISVERSRCIGRVHMRGIVIRETKSAFVICTEINQIKILPKEHTTFNVGVRLPGQTPADFEIPLISQHVVSFRLYGSQLRYRAADRSGRKFKNQGNEDL